MKTPIDFSGLVDLFNPKTEAEGATLLAKTRSLDSDARYNDARTGLIGDRRNALSNEGKLLAAGYTPRQILAMQTAQSDSVADVFNGVRSDTGTQMLTSGGDARQAGILLNFAKAGDKDFAATDTRADTLRNEDAANELAKTIAGATARGTANKPVSLAPGYKLIDPATGNVIAEGGEPNARPVVLTPGGVLVDAKTGERIAAGNDATTTLSPGQTLVNKGTGAAVGSAPAKITERAAGQKAINELIVSALGGVRDKKSGDVRVEDDGTTLPLDYDQVTKITAKAKELGATPENYEQKVKEAAEALGIRIDSKEVVRGPWRFFNWFGDKTGFRFPQGVAPAAPEAPAAPAPTAPARAAAAPSAPAAGATPAGAIVVTTQADIDNAPSGAILIVNGVPMRKP